MASSTPAWTLFNTRNRQHGSVAVLTAPAWVRRSRDGPTTIRLDDDLDVALGHATTHLDRLCQSVIITDR